MIGRWRRSPFGAFTDVMIEDAAGHRRLVAPRQEIADFIAATYTFDAVEIARIGVTAHRHEWAVDAGPLHVAFELGRRQPLGVLLRSVPPPLARRPFWISAIDRRPGGSCRACGPSAARATGAGSGTAPRTCARSGRRSRGSTESTSVAWQRSIRPFGSGSDRFRPSPGWCG